MHSEVKTRVYFSKSKEKTLLTRTKENLKDHKWTEDPREGSALPISTQKAHKRTCGLEMPITTGNEQITVK